jgi:hypothetical protein
MDVSRVESKKATGHEKRVTSARSVRKCACADSVSGATAGWFDNDDEWRSEARMKHDEAQ